MKRFILIILSIGCIMITMFLSSCISSEADKYKYVPNGEFYVKTSPADGDRGVINVIDIEAEYKSYQGEGNITVPVTIGFGHLPDQTLASDEDENDTFFLLYEVYEYPLKEKSQPVWQKRVDYSDSFYSAKYNSTEQKNGAFLFIPMYGQFYPLYKEEAEIVFPEGVQSGIVFIKCFIVDEEYSGPSEIERLSFSFTHADGVLSLDSED